jgi:hypothetical protein
MGAANVRGIPQDKTNGAIGRIPERSQAAVDFVRDRVLRLLKGEVRSVIRGLRRMATTAGLRSCFKNR